MIKKYIGFFIISILALVDVKAQQSNIYPMPRPKNCEYDNICPSSTIFPEARIRFKNNKDSIPMFGLFTLNYDHTIICREKYLVSYTVGVDFWSFKKTRSLGVPATINFMLGGGAIMLETSLGLDYLFVYKNYNHKADSMDNKQHYLGLLGRIGLRYEKKKSLFIRAGYTPMLSLINFNKIPILVTKRYNSMFGLGVGYTFK